MGELVSGKEMGELEDGSGSGRTGGTNPASELRVWTGHVCDYSRS